MRMGIFLILLGASLLAPAPSIAQYMYLDANGDGVNTSADVLNPTGPTTVDIWIDTNHDKSGATVTCSDGSTPLTIFSYEFILQTSGGTVSWGAFTNDQPQWTTNLGLASSNTEYHNGFAGAVSPSPPGLYELGSMTITIASGSPAVLFGTSSSLSSNYITEFGSACPGTQFDNTLQLGRDWFDTAGLLTTAPLYIPPVPSLAGTNLSFDTAQGPYAVAVGDFNADGRPDVVVSNASNGSGASVSVLLASGDGTYRTFLPHVDYATGSQPQSIAVADVNRDGKPDLVTGNWGSGTVSVLLGNGDGTFGSHADFAAGANPAGLSVADLNGDSKVDLVVTNYFSSTVSVLLGNGDGTFASPVGYPTGVYPVGVVAVNVGAGSSLPDLVVANSGSNTVSVLPDSGTGSFGTRVDYPTAGQPVAVAAAQFRSGTTSVLDLAVACSSSGDVSVLLGNGDGTFGARTDYPAGVQPISVTTGDFNGDGVRDLAVDDGLAAGYVLLANGDGSFASPVTLETGADPYGLAAAEMNGDSHPDLIVANHQANTISVFLGNGDGTFGSSVYQGTGDNQGPGYVSLGDLNGDGKLDAVVVGRKAHTPQAVSVFLGDGSGAFGPKADYESEGWGTSVVIADWNNDGKPDVVATVRDVDGISLLPGNGDGTFGGWLYYGTGPTPSSVAAADLNGDGWVDLAVANSGNSSVVVCLNSGGTFNSRTPYTTGLEPLWVLAGDVDGDGIPDLVVSNYEDGTVSVLTGNGDGTFAPKVDYPAGASPVALAMGDVTGDGRPDLVVTNDGTAHVSVLANTGSGFGAPVAYTTGLDPHAVGLTDMNGDGKLDIVTTNTGGANTVTVLFGDGTGSFPIRADFGAGANVYGLALGNIGGGPLPDVVVTNSLPDTLGKVRSLVNRVTVTAVGRSAPAPQRTGLMQNFPNPFNPVTTITFTLEHPGFARLRVFDIQGRVVSTLVRGALTAGLHTAVWGGLDGKGRPAPSGVYFCRLESGRSTESRKMVLAR